jgi:hypothetical protein
MSARVGHANCAEAARKSSQARMGLHASPRGAASIHTYARCIAHLVGALCDNGRHVARALCRTRPREDGLSTRSREHALGIGGAALVAHVFALAAVRVRTLVAPAQCTRRTQTRLTPSGHGRRWRVSTASRPLSYLWGAAFSVHQQTSGGGSLPRRGLAAFGFAGLRGCGLQRRRTLVYRRRLAARQRPSRAPHTTTPSANLSHAQRTRHSEESSLMLESAGTV